MTTTKKSSKVDIANLPYEIIKVIQNNIETLKHQPQHLAWCLLCYDLMHSACRLSTGSYTNNPKYIFIDNPKEDWPTLNKKEQNMLYEAWGVSISDLGIPQDRLSPLVPHNKMTLDDWIALKTNPEYVQQSLSGDNKFAITSNILCSHGTEFIWHSNGYIIEGEDDVDHSVFWGFTQAESQVDEKIRKKILKICEDERVKYHFDILYKTAVEFNKLTKKQRDEVEYELYLVSSKRQLETITNPKGTVTKISDTIHLDIINKVKKNSVSIKETQLAGVNKAFAKDKERYKDTPVSVAYREGHYFYPFDKSSNIANIPEKAHPSYIKEAMRIAKIVVSGKPCINDSKGGLSPATPEMIKVSKKIIKKWEPKGY